MRMEVLGLEVLASIVVSVVAVIALKTGKAGFLFKSLDVDRKSAPKTYWAIVWAWITLAAWSWYDALLEI